MLLQAPIVENLVSTGLQEDCPFDPSDSAQPLSPQAAESIDTEAFSEYAGRLNQYLQVNHTLHIFLYAELWAVNTVHEKIPFIRACNDLSCVILLSHV